MVDRRREIRAAYDAVAEPYTADRSESPAELSFLADLLADLPGVARVLDAGCGAGDPVTSFLAERVETVGMDFSRAQLELAGEGSPAAAIVQSDMTALPFADGAFGALCSVYAVIHVPWELHRECFAEFRRVLRAGAPALLTVGTTDWTGSNDDWMDYGAAMHCEIPGREQTAELLAEVGFEVAWSETVADDVSEEDGEKLFVRAQAV